MNKKIFLLLILIFSPFLVLSEKTSLHFNPWELIIYRPENTQNLNQIRSYLKICDQNGNDITFSKKIKISYEWVTIPDKANYFKNKVYLSGGMAIHLNLPNGKYFFSVYTPKDEHYEFPSENQGEWRSNVFEYDTAHPLKAIFVFPVANENGFYTGEWKIDYKAPKFYKFTKPKMP